jgi:acetyl-CoA synthetase (ADP-forming)
MTPFMVSGMVAYRRAVMSSTLSEADSTALLSGYGVPFAPQRLVDTAEDAAAAATELGYPVVAKLCGDAIAHKTERGLVRLRLTDAASVSVAATDLLAAARPEDGPVQVLVAAMVSGTRELIAGLARDPQFGMTVMVGIGGVLAEALGDVSIRLAPIDRVDATEMLDDLHTQALLGDFRGEPALDRAAMIDVLMALSAVADARPDIASVDLNPLLVVDGVPIAVDALVEIGGVA